MVKNILKIIKGKKNINLLYIDDKNELLTLVFFYFVCYKQPKPKIIYLV